MQYIRRNQASLNAVYWKFSEPKYQKNQILGKVIMYWKKSLLIENW